MNRLNAIPSLDLPQHPAGSSWNLFIVELTGDATDSQERDQLIHDLRERGILAHMHYPLLHTQPLFRTHGTHAIFASGGALRPQSLDSAAICGTNPRGNPANWRYTAGPTRAGHVNTVAVILARAASTRLPNKMFLPFGEHSILDHVIERVRACRQIDDCVLATSENPRDQAFASVVSRQQIRWFQGVKTTSSVGWYRPSKTVHRLQRRSFAFAQTIRC